MKSTLKAMLCATALTAAAGVAAADGIEKIGLAVPNLQADFFNQIKLGVEGYAEKLGIEVITVDAKGDTATQVSQVQDLMTQGIDAFIYIPPALPPLRFRPVLHGPKASRSSTSTRTRGRARRYRDLR